MNRARSKLKAFIIFMVAAMQLATLAAPVPGLIYAQEAAVEPVPCVAPANVSHPTGAGSHTFAWNCDSNLWENAYYTFNPANYAYTAKFAPEHKFNEAAGIWQVWEWKYIPASDKYELRVTSSYAPAVAEAADTAPDTQGAAISNTGPDSTNGITDANGSIQNTGPDSTNTIDGTNGLINNTGPDSMNTIGVDGNGGNTDFDLEVDIDATTDIDSTAVSGDASVLQNTTAGSALTGDATAMANILNMLQSTWGWNGALAPEVFTANIQGDYVGDIMIDPSYLGIGSNPCGCGDLTVNSSLDASLTNNVDLLAQTGDATVSGNTKAGDATSGNATALANIINMINSSITAGESFLGVLNIHGDFEGDVLIAQDVIDELIAANVPTTEVTLCDCDLMAEFNTAMAIDNNISTAAASGNATVSNNTSAGNAASGSAETSVTVFNVTGRTIVGRNALLVFVNVLGEWVGFIVDAPAGATAAAFGGGLTQNSVADIGGDTEINADTDMSITNNINVAAQTGDAEVSYNTTAGNASSGNAKASANVSNILGSNFSLSGWFGLLFINILGNWFGSFGVDTPYGNTTLPTPQGASGSVGSVQTAHTSTSSRSSVKKSGKPVANANVRVFDAAFEEADNGGVVLASVTEATPPTQNPEQGFGSTPANPNAIIGWSLVAFGSATVYYFIRRRGSV